MIRLQKSVHRLILGHNELGDKGCHRLFNFLSSEGSEYNIQEIHLNANIIGDDGLLVISEYLKDNQHVRKLFLQHVRLQLRLFFLYFTDNFVLRILSEVHQRSPRSSSKPLIPHVWKSFRCPQTNTFAITSSLNFYLH